RIVPSPITSDGLAVYFKAEQLHRQPLDDLNGTVGGRKMLDGLLDRGSGIAVRDGFLYASSATNLHRFRLPTFSPDWSYQLKNGETWDKAPIVLVGGTLFAEARTPTAPPAD